MWTINDDGNFEIVIKLGFTDIDEFSKIIWHDRTELEFGLQTRLVGKPFLVISFKRQDILEIEHPKIFLWLKALLLNKRIKFNCYLDGDLDEPFDDITINLAERHLNNLEFLLSLERFYLQYGIYIGENGHGI